MAHNFTERDGMFTVRQAAWHNLQTAIFPDYPTRKEAQEIAHPWEPITEPVYRKIVAVQHSLETYCAAIIETGKCDDPNHQVPVESFEQIEEFKAVVRSDINTTLGVQPVTWEPILNDEMYDIAEAIEKGDGKGDVMFETGGSLKGGRKVWLLTRLKDPIVLGGRKSSATLLYWAIQNAMDGSGAFRGQATNVQIVCHEAGTPMLHEGHWITVEEHPSFVGMKSEPGLKVSIEGLPFTETVTLDHRYWAARWGEDPRWVEARDLVKGEHRLVYPVDMVQEVPENLPAFADDPDFWWVVGQWWGDGSTSCSRRSDWQNHVQWTVSKSEVKERLLGFLIRNGFTGRGSARPGCHTYDWASQEMFDLLDGWYGQRTGVGKGSREKVPPFWVERLPVEWQTQIVQGYFEADGFRQRDRDADIFTSVSLEGLLTLRRILMRLGRPSSIRAGRKKELASSIQGRQVNARDQWTLRVADRPRGVQIVEGALHSDVRLVEWVSESKFVPITTPDHTYITHFGLMHNCDNTSQMADWDAKQNGTEFVFRHTKNVKDRIEEAKKALAGWRESVDAWTLQAEHMLTLRITSAQREEYLREFVPEPPAQVITDRVRNNIEQARQQVRAILDGPTCEDIHDTAYGLVQASIEYSQHYRRSKSKESGFQRAYLDKSRLTEQSVRLATAIATGA